MARHVLGVAIVADDIAQRIGRGVFTLLDLRAMVMQALLDLGNAFLDLVQDAMALVHVLLLGDLDAHHVIALGRLAVDGKAGRVGAAMLERAQHRRHLGAHIRALAAMDQSCNSTHGYVLPSGFWVSRGGPARGRAVPLPERP